MGQKTNPIGNRLGIIRGWDSNWYGGNDYGDKIAEDYKIRKYIHARLSKASVSKVIIERTLKLVTVTPAKIQAPTNPPPTQNTATGWLQLADSALSPPLARIHASAWLYTRHLHAHNYAATNWQQARHWFLPF